MIRPSLWQNGFEMRFWIFYITPKSANLNGKKPMFRPDSDVFQIVEPKMKNLPIAWSCDVEPSLGSIEVDRSALRTALVNILENAVEACVEDSVKPSHRIGFSARANGNQVLFEVCDDGIGMDQADSGKAVFPVFFFQRTKRNRTGSLYCAKSYPAAPGDSFRAFQPGKGNNGRVTPFRSRLRKLRIENLELLMKYTILMQSLDTGSSPASQEDS